MTKRDAVNLPHDRKFLRLDFAQLQKMAEVFGMIAAEFGGGRGDPVFEHYLSLRLSLIQHLCLSAHTKVWSLFSQTSCAK